MKKYLPFLSLGMAISLGSNAQTGPGFLYAGTIPDCVARWTFDGNSNVLADSSGNNNNGLLANTTTALGWRDMPMQGAKFNGFSSKGDVPIAPSLQFQNATIVALVKFDGFYSGICQGNNIIGSHAYQDFEQGSFFFRVADNEYDGDCNTVSPDHNTFSSLFHNDGEPPTTKPFIQTDKWYFLAASFQNGVEKKLFQVEMDTNFYAPPAQAISETSTIGYTYTPTTNPMRIGYHNSDTNPYWFNGVMDELVIFNRALNLREISNVYDYLWNKGVATTDTATSIKDNEIKRAVSLTKTGSKYQFTINNGKRYNAVLTDMLGKKLQALTVEHNSVIDLSSYAVQVFILNLFDNNGQYAFKVHN